MHICVAFVQCFALKLEFPDSGQVLIAVSPWSSLKSSFSMVLNVPVSPWSWPLTQNFEVESCCHSSACCKANWLCYHCYYFLQLLFSLHEKYI